jgi:Family of unknown function (DUF5343)
MSLPTAYLTSAKNTQSIFQAIQAAQAPPRFTTRFLEGLGFSNSNDRAIINVLKSLGLLDDSGVPTKRYHEYLDQSQSATVLANAIREAYADLFRVNRAAQTMTQTDVKNKMKTLSEGQFTDRVLTQMAMTFTALVKLADFSASTPAGALSTLAEQRSDEGDATPPATIPQPSNGVQSAPAPTATARFGLMYNINIHLPESRDQAVYDALFKALKEHLA